MRDLHAVTAIRRAALHVVQEDDLSIPFLYADRGVVDTVELAGQRGHFMIVRGKERAGFVDLVQMFERRPSDRQPVISCGASADFVKDHDGAVIGLV